MFFFGGLRGFERVFGVVGFPWLSTTKGSAPGSCDAGSYDAAATAAGPGTSSPTFWHPFFVSKGPRIATGSPSMDTRFSELSWAEPEDL